jgi:hypothetical protein
MEKSFPTFLAWDGVEYENSISIEGCGRCEAATQLRPPPGPPSKQSFASQQRRPVIPLSAHRVASGSGAAAPSANVPRQPLAN